MIIILSAEFSDTEDLLPLLDQLGYPTTKELLEKKFDKFISNEGYSVAVTSLNNKIVGFVAWSQSNLFVADKIRLHIEGIVVDKNTRGQNMGKQLMQFVENYAVQFSPATIDLTSGLRRASK
jgi:ribosomal protein S18 acetylase RimI-like enzyme